MGKKKFKIHSDGEKIYAYVYKTLTFFGKLESFPLVLERKAENLPLSWELPESGKSFQKLPESVIVCRCPLNIIVVKIPPTSYGPQKREIPTYV